MARIVALMLDSAALHALPQCVYGGSELAGGFRHRHAPTS
jgi:hypothetical protein